MATLDASLGNPGTQMIREEGSRVLLVVFSGLGAGKAGSPPYHLMNSTRRFAVNKLYVRDLDDGYYHYGLRGVSDDIDGTADFLRRLIADREMETVVMLGSSSGAYAALLLGWLIEAAEVHAITPTTNLDRDSPLNIGAARSEPLYRRIHDSGRGQEKYFDLGELFRARPDIATRFHVYYSTGNDIDRDNAERMRRFRCVRLHAYDGDNHLLVRDLVRRADFNRRLDEALREPGRDGGDGG